jgi:1-deoxy-D-xylulose-5-phosphate reductoisomerase
MGPKITIFSDTMMNKGFEVIEAHYLFSWPAEKIGILIQPESRVHSLLKMKDGTYWAEVSEPDMHGPIRYALHEGRDRSSLRHERRLEDFGPYAFRPFDPQRYPAVPMCLSALAEGGVKPAILNAADEEAVGLFLKGKAAFTDIEKICAAALSHLPNISRPSLRDILSSDALARLYVLRRYGKEASQ